MLIVLTDWTRGSGNHGCSWKKRTVACLLWLICVVEKLCLECDTAYVYTIMEVVVSYAGGVLPKRK